MILDFKAAERRSAVIVVSNIHFFEEMHGI